VILVKFHLVGPIRWIVEVNVADQVADELRAMLDKQVRVVHVRGTGPDATSFSIPARCILFISYTSNLVQ